MKKILLLSERFPFPPTSGTKNLLYNYCKIFHESLGMQVVSVSFSEGDDNVSLRPNFIDRIYELPDPGMVVKVRNLAIETLLKRRLPMQVSLFWDPSIKKKIDEILENEKPDFVIADLVRTSEYLKDYRGFKILDMQDLFSLRYERQLLMEMGSVNPYGAYLFRFPKAVQSILESSFLKTTVMKNEIRLLKKYEKEIGKKYDRVMFVARKEGETYDHTIGEHKALIAPLGVDYDYFSSLQGITKKPSSMAFMGALSVAHNESGIIYFAEHILPLILLNNPNAKLYIIGGGVTEKIKKLASESIIVTGRVDDVREAVGSCEVFVCPLRFGSGIKTKNLEAMAMGVPVVTTPIGAENIDAKHAHDWYVAQNDQEFADYVCMLLKDRQYRDSVGHNGQVFVKQNFIWSNAEDAFREVLGMPKNNRGGVLHKVVGYPHVLSAAVGKAVA